MAILLAILAGLKTFGSAVLGILDKIPWQIWACVGSFLLGGWVFNGGSCRDFACGRTPRPPATREYTVVAVVDSGHIEVSYGLRERRTTTIALFGYRVPEEVEAQAVAELTRLAGSSVNLQEARPKKVKSTAEPPEALRPPQSICYVSGAHGSCGVGLLRAGLAIDESGLGDWVTAQNKAKKEKLGIWSKDKVR